MKFYDEITLLPDHEIGLHFLWEKIFQQIHLGFAEIKKDNEPIPIGISFPEYELEKCYLGSKLRLLASHKEILTLFDVSKRLRRLIDYIHVKRTKELQASEIQHARFKRVQVKSSIERIARRKARRESISFEAAMHNLNGFEEQRIQSLPFIKMKSLSSDQNFKLFIKKEVVNTAINKGFNSYGLSNQSTVPDFI